MLAGGVRPGRRRDLRRHRHVACRASRATPAPGARGARPPALADIADARGRCADGRARRAGRRPPWRRSSPACRPCARCGRSSAAASNLPDDARSTKSTPGSRARRRQFAGARARRRRPARGARRRRAGRGRASRCRLTVIAANRGASAIAVTHDRRSAASTATAGVCKTGAGGRRAACNCCDGGHSRSRSRPRLTGPYWRTAAGRRALRVRRRRAVRPAVPADAVPRAPFDLDDRRRRHARAERDVQYRYEGNIFSGEKRMELHVVPRLAVIADARRSRSCRPPRHRRPARGRARAARHGDQRHTKGADRRRGRRSRCRRAGPSRRPSATVSFAREDEAATVRFTVTPPRRPRKPGWRQHQGRAPRAGAERRFTRTATRWSSTRTRARRHLVRAAEATLKVIDVNVAAAPQRGLRDGRRRPGAAGDRAARRARRRCSTPTTSRGATCRPLRRHRDRRARLRTPAGPAREQPPPARLRAEAAARSSSSTTSSSSTRRSTGRSRQGDQPPRDRRARAREGARAGAPDLHDPEP